MTNNHQDNTSTTQLERARRGARRTAWLLAGIVVVIYVGFMVFGALGK